MLQPYSSIRTFTIILHQALKIISAENVQWKNAAGEKNIYLWVKCTAVYWKNVHMGRQNVNLYIEQTKHHTCIEDGDKWEPQQIRDLVTKVTSSHQCWKISAIVAYIQCGEYNR